MSATTRWLGRRVLLSVLVLWGATTMTFVGLHVLPGDMAHIILAGSSGGLAEDPTPEQLAIVRHEHGLDRPIVAQYGTFISGIVRGDLGPSYRLNQPARDLIGEQIGATLALAAGASVLAFGLALTVGVTTAGRRAPRAIANALELVFISMPSFLIGIILLTAFSFRLHVFPVTGNGGIRSLILPWCSLALPVGAALAVVMREGLERALEQPFALTVRGRGATEWRLRLRHALRHSILPVLTLSGWVFGQLLGGTVVVETVFARQGLGQMAVAAVTTRDLPIIAGIVLVAALAFVTISTVIDLLYRVIDPRLRASAR